MLEEEKIIALFFERSEQAIRELDNRYGKILCNASYHFPATGISHCHEDVRR